MASVDEAVASFERNIEAQTGRSVADWATEARETGLERHGQIVAWLKGEKGLTHGVANHIAKRALAPAAADEPADPVASLFAQDKAAIRPLYDRLIEDMLALGGDVEIAPKKANVSIRRRKQFALLQPTTRTRLDLGLVLKDRPPEGRLEASGSFNAMVTHRVKIAAAGDIDDQLRGWIREAYDGAV